LVDKQVERVTGDWLEEASKGEAGKLHAWTGPEGSRSLRVPEFKTIGTWRW
jgi:hypothetical protein